MNRLSAAVTVALLVLASSTSAGAQTVPILTLEQAVDEALRNNDRLLNQRDSIEQADLGLRLARNAFRPHVTPNVLGSFGGTDLNSQTYRLDVSQRLTTGTEIRVGTGTASAQIPGLPGVSDQDLLFYNADTTVTVSQPLLRGFGRTVTRRSLASAELQRADADRLQAMSTQQVAIEVASAYYRVVSQQTMIEVATRSLDRSRKLRDAAEAKLGAGLVSQLDVLRAQQLVAQAETQLFDAQSGLEDGRDALRFVMGRTGDEVFDIQSTIDAPDARPLDVERAVALALSNRLDLKSRAAANADAADQLRFARNQLLPQVDVNFALTRRRTSSSFGGSFRLDGFQFATFFTIAMPVDRTAQQVSFQTAQLDRGRRARELSTMERQITNDVRSAVRERGRMLRNLLAADTSIAIRRTEVEVAQFRYERGLSNNLDVVTAESSLLMAESQRVQALADSAVATLRLRALLGVLSPRADVGQPAALPTALIMARGPESAVP